VSAAGLGAVRDFALTAMLDDEANEQESRREDGEHE
jgi:hypothetical protein